MLIQENDSGGLSLRSVTSAGIYFMLYYLQQKLDFVNG